MDLFPLSLEIVKEIQSFLDWKNWFKSRLISKIWNQFDLNNEFHKKMFQKNQMEKKLFNIPFSKEKEIFINFATFQQSQAETERIRKLMLPPTYFQKGNYFLRFPRSNDSLHQNNISNQLADFFQIWDYIFEDILCFSITNNYETFESSLSRIKELLFTLKELNIHSKTKTLIIFYFPEPKSYCKFFIPFEEIYFQLYLDKTDFYFAVIHRNDRQPEYQLITPMFNYIVDNNIANLSLYALPQIWDQLHILRLLFDIKTDFNDYKYISNKINHTRLLSNLLKTNISSVSIHHMNGNNDVISEFETPKQELDYLRDKKLINGPMIFVTAKQNTNKLFQTFVNLVNNIVVNLKGFEKLKIEYSRGEYGFSVPNFSKL